MKTTVQQFFMFSVVFGLVMTVAAFISGFNYYVIGGVFFVSTFGFPRWVVSYKRKKRFKAFMQEFPNAVDVIVRGVKAGLPLNDCLAIIARESKDPVGPEFRKIVESQQMGMTMADAIAKLYENIPLSEANFFGIVIAIQQSAGGNLSEALGNLSNVLRDRKKLDGKIKAMSAEAKASAGIIGSLPFCVTALVYLTTPDYITLLFTHPTGHMIIGGSLHLDVHGHHGDEENDQLRFLSGAVPVGDIIAIVLEPRALLAILASLAVFATVLTIAMPIFQQDELASRMNSTVIEREKIRQRERERLAAEKKRGTLKNTDSGLMKEMVERFNLKKALADQSTFDNLKMAGYRKQSHVYVFLFFRLGLAADPSGGCVDLCFRNFDDRTAVHDQAADRHGCRLCRFLSAKPVCEKPGGQSASCPSAGHGLMRLT